MIEIYALRHKLMWCVCTVACTYLLCGCQAILCSAEDAADKTELINSELCSFWALLLFQKTADGESPRVATRSEKKGNINKRNKKGLTEECWHLCLLKRCSCWCWVSSGEKTSITEQERVTMLQALNVCGWICEHQINAAALSTTRALHETNCCRTLLFSPKPQVNTAFFSNRHGSPNCEQFFQS